MSDIDFGQLSEALNDKSDRDLRNVDTTAKADAVIDYQEPTSANGYTWYRKYKSGWVEQGGENAGKTINLPITMANADYTCVFAAGGRTGSGADISPYITLKNTTYIQLVLDRSVNINWQVSGIAAN